MRIRFTHLFVLFIAFVISAGSAVAEITLTACFSSGPDPFNPSPSLAGYVANALTGLQNGCTATGDPTLPTFYQSSTVFAPGQVIDSDPDVNSWNGGVNPTGAFSGEFGNQLLDGLFITDNGGIGGTFSVSELNFVENSSDFSFDQAGSGFTYGANNPWGIVDLEGIVNNPTGPPTIIDSGPATQMVDELVFAGIGDSFCAAPSICGYSVADQLSYIMGVEPLLVTNEYSLVDGSGNLIAAVTNDAVLSPEPREGLALAVLLSIMAFVRYRRRPAD